MKIKILRCSGNYWYADKVGQVKDLTRRENLWSKYQGIPGDVYWCREGGIYNASNWVLCSDAEVVDEPQHEIAQVPNTVTTAYHDSIVQEAVEQRVKEVTALRTEVERWKKIAESASAEREHNANVAAQLRAEVAKTVYVGGKYATVFDERNALRAEVERWKAAANHHRDLGITLLDAKWLDPECHKGCQSLVLKQRAERAEANMARLQNWIVEIGNTAHIAYGYSNDTRCTAHILSIMERARAAIDAAKGGAS
jgi:hypothetical protein